MVEFIPKCDKNYKLADEKEIQQTPSRIKTSKGPSQSNRYKSVM